MCALLNSWSLHHNIISPELIPSFHTHVHTTWAGRVSYTVALNQHNTPIWDKDAIQSSASIRWTGARETIAESFSLFLYIPLCSSPYPSCWTARAFCRLLSVSVRVGFFCITRHSSYSSLTNHHCSISSDPRYQNVTDFSRTAMVRRQRSGRVKKSEAVWAGL